MRSSTEITINIDDFNKLDSLYRSMKVEGIATQSNRGSVKVSRNENALNISIAADDFVALRALTNSFMRILKLALEVIELDI